MSLSNRLPLRIAIATYGHTAALKDGRVEIAGTAPEFIEVSPIIAAFRRMVRDLEFDVCEMAPTTYVIARAAGIPMTALPIFLSRRFHHSGLICRKDAGIKKPRDLEGKKVGVRAYSVTTGVWTRGILMNEYGLDNDRVSWVVDDEEHVTSLRLPANVEHAPAGRSLNEMMAAGEIQAGFTSRAGIGRKGAPKAGWEAAGEEVDDYNDLFENVAEIEAEWYRKTGIYPMHGCIVVRGELLAAHPWLAGVLLDAFSAAKQIWLTRLRSNEEGGADEKKYRGLAKLVGDDPLPYGLEENRASIDALITYAWQQKLIPSPVKASSMFLDPRTR